MNKTNISAKQIKTVLRMYNKQLRLARIISIMNDVSLPQLREDKIKLSMRIKRQRINQQIANHVVEKLAKDNGSAPGEIEEKQEG